MCSGGVFTILKTLYCLTIWLEKTKEYAPLLNLSSFFLVVAFENLTMVSLSSVNIDKKWGRYYLHQTEEKTCHSPAFSPS